MKLYQHYKGGLYVVTDEHALDATNEKSLYVGTGAARVAYCDLQDNKFSREFHEFHEDVEYQGKVGPRFRAITDAADIMPEGGHP
jgi:hypothetical protein